MHPAPSVIIFTVFSGLGFGMLAFLAMGFPDVYGLSAFVFFAIGYACAVGGLISSTFHLGNPKNAIKAFSQWRSSWLSREGICAVAALCVTGLYAIGKIFFSVDLAPLGWLAAALCIVTVFTTSMIYAQLATIPRWNHWNTPFLLLSLSLAGGALMTGQIRIAMIGFAVAAIAQILAWVMGDKRFAARGSTIETATGLGRIGAVRQFEPPHTGTNYLLSEMVHVVGRKHAMKLRVIGFVLAFVLPAVLLMISISHAMAVPVVISHIAGVLVLR
ncbi:MAG: DmsC/YnfH family molybdoenzyme membrane anchor subunit, partial [Pseudomonadota bacterium]